MSRALCRRGVPRGAVSRAFLAEELLRALPVRDECVYVELDAQGRVTAAGALGAAALAARARLAPHVPAAAALLELAAPAPAHGGQLALRVRVVREAAPHDELPLWFAPDALAALRVPFLAPAHIRGKRDYVCCECGARFEQPNPLKLHLLLRCAHDAHDARRVWRRVAERMRAPTPATPTLASPGPGPTPAPAALEALAAAWGRSRAGHVCVYCGKLCSRRYGLKIHLRTHTGYRPLRCRHCARAFGDPSNLNKHVRLHAARGQ